MTAQFSHLGITTRHTSSGGGRAFSISLLGVTVLPIALILNAPYFLPMAWGVDFFLAVASAHVFATVYLLTDRGNLHFILDHPVQLIVMPILLFMACILVFITPANPLFTPAIMLFFLYQTWHFGSQNIGVAMFISLSERGIAINKSEKNIIRLGTVCGMLGVLSALYLDFMIGQQYVRVDEGLLRTIRFLHDIGAIAAAALAGWAFLLLLKAWRRNQFLYGVAIFLSATFLFSMYLSDNYMIAVASFSIAHGLQYVVFLAAHSVSSSRTSHGRSLRFQAYLLPPVALVAIIGIGHLIWTRAPALQSEQFPLVGLSILLGLTLSHFWVDQFMWRMRNAERAKWVKENFGFIFPAR